MNRETEIQRTSSGLPGGGGACCGATLPPGGVSLGTAGDGFLLRCSSRFSTMLAGGKFPAFVLCLLAFYQVFIALMAFTPPAGGAWGDFVEYFRVRCFQYNPESGLMRLGSVWIMLTEPLPLQAIVFLIWRGPLRDLWRTRRGALLPLAASAMVIVGAIAASLLGLGRAQAQPAELPFPADRLRTSLPMPAFTLVNQDGQTVSLADCRGQVVLVTAVYGTCTRTCPMLLTKIRLVLDQLTPAERQQLTVVALSLNPEADTPELRARTAQLYGLKAPRFHFVNGVPGEVNRLLDQMDVTRERDPRTGEITHSNLFFLLDRAGRIAYRLSLSQNEQSWLSSALRVLLAEKTADGGATP